MVQCAAAGVSPRQFRRYTLGEIWVVLEGEQQRRHNDLLGRVVACVRALSHSFGKGNALDGIVPDNQAAEIAPAAVRKLRFWRQE